MFGYLTIILYVGLIIWGLSLNGKNAIKLLICLCFYQNIVLVVMSRYISSTQFTILALLKELYVHGYIVVLIIKKRRISKLFFELFIGEVILVACLFLHGAGSIMVRLSSFRQLYLPFVFGMFAVVCNITQNEKREVIRFYTKNCIVACIFGAIEMILRGRLWLSLGIISYAIDKGIASQIGNDGLLRSFYTYDYGMKIRRMASVLVDPVILGQLLALGLIFCIFYNGIFDNKSSKIAGTIILTAGLLLTFAKGGIVIAILSSCILFGKVLKKKVLSVVLIIFAVAASGYYISNVIYTEISGSIRHYGGLVSGIEVLKNNIFGRGSGSAGNLAIADGEHESAAMAGAESYIGSLLAQIGIIGIVLSLYFWGPMFIRLRQLANRFNENNIILWATISLLVTSFVNYTAISFNSCFIYFIIAITSVFNNEGDINSENRYPYVSYTQ